MTVSLYPGEADRPPRTEGLTLPPPCPPKLLWAVLTRAIQEVSPPWAPIMYRMSRVVVATKQNTDTNITQPWTRAMGTREEAIRIHTRPPKTCMRGGRGTVRPEESTTFGGPSPSGHKGL
jgi:hypothetical protein